MSGEYQLHRDGAPGPARQALSIKASLPVSIFAVVSHVARLTKAKKVGKPVCPRFSFVLAERLNVVHRYRFADSLAAISAASVVAQHGQHAHSSPITAPISHRAAYVIWAERPAVPLLPRPFALSGAKLSPVPLFHLPGLEREHRFALNAAKRYVGGRFYESIAVGIVGGKAIDGLAPFGPGVPFGEWMPHRTDGQMPPAAASIRAKSGCGHAVWADRKQSGADLAGERRHHKALLRAIKTVTTHRAGRTTGVACARLGRRYIGIERDPTYFAAGKARLEAEVARLAEAGTTSPAKSPRLVAAT